MFENQLQTQMSGFAEFCPNHTISTSEAFFKMSISQGNNRGDFDRSSLEKKLDCEEEETEQGITEECLQINYIYLKDEMESCDVLDHLHSVDLFSDSFLETCRETQMRRRRNDLMIKEIFKIAKTKSRSILQHFINALRKTGQEHIVNYLLTQKCSCELENQIPTIPVDFITSMSHRIIEDVEPRDIIDNLLVNKAISFLDHEDVEQLQHRADRVKTILQKASESKNCLAEITRAINDAYPKLIDEFEQRAENDAKNQPAVSIRLHLQSVSMHDRESEEQCLRQIERNAVYNFDSSLTSSNRFTDDLEECICKLERLEISSIVIQLMAKDRDSLEKILIKLRGGRAIDWLFCLLNKTDKQRLKEMEAYKLLVSVRVNEEGNFFHIQPPEGCLCQLNKDIIIENKDTLSENLKSSDIEELVVQMEAHGINGPISTNEVPYFLDFLIMENKPRICFCIFEEYIKARNPSLLTSLLSETEQDTVPLNPDIKEHEIFLAEELEVHAYLPVIQKRKNEKSIRFLKKIAERQGRSSRVKEFLNFIICEDDSTWFWDEVRKKQKYVWDYILTSRKHDTQLKKDVLAAKLMNEEIVEEVNPLRLKSYMNECTLEKFGFGDIEKIQCRKLQAQYLMNRLSTETIDVFMDALSKGGYNRIRNQIKAGSLAEKYACPRIHDSRFSSDKKNFFKSEFYITAHFTYQDDKDYTEIPPAVQLFGQRHEEAIEHSESFGQSFDHGDDTALDIAPAENVDKNRTNYSGTGNALDVQGHRQQKGEKSTDDKEILRSNSDPCARKDKADEIYSWIPTYKIYSEVQKDVQRKQEVSSRPLNRNLKPDLTEYKWYHGNIGKSIAKERLRGKEHGSFLVRDASGVRNADHPYTMEFIDENTVKKLMIMKTSSKYHFKEYEDKKFDRVEQLIYTLMTKGLQVKDSASDRWKTIRVKPVSYE